MKPTCGAAVGRSKPAARSLFEVYPAMSHIPANVTAKRRRSAFTLVEILIVVVIMAVLAATIIPSFSNSVADAKVNTATFNLNTLRSQIEHYRAEHDGKVPTGTTLPELFAKTDKDGAVGTGVTHVYGPYLRAIPENTISGSKAVKLVTGAAAAPGDVTASNAGGWLYNATTGGIWIDHDVHYVE
jgi:prepilin-type N-terminal cleavage/methylation domain-containing protein